MPAWLTTAAVSPTSPAYARDRLRTRRPGRGGHGGRARALRLAGGSPRDVGAGLGGADAEPGAAGGLADGRARAWLRLAGRVWPATLEHLPADTEVPRPVVVGVVGAVTGLDAAQVARLVAYDDAQTVVAASLEAAAASTRSTRPAGWPGCTTTSSGSSPTCPA